MRIKPQVGKLESLDDVNLALRDIGLMEKELDAIDAKAAKDIAEIKTRAAKDGEELRKDITPHMTNLYDSYYKEKSIKKEQFNSLKNYFGEILSNAKNTINDCGAMLSMLKQEKKLVESLLVTE